MVRTKTLSLLAILVLLLTLLPTSVMAQGPAAPANPPVPLQIEEATAIEEVDAGKATAPATPLDGLALPDGMDLFSEVEPNGTPAEATALPGNDIVAVGNVFPNGDLDFFSFSGNAGDRVYAATMTSQSASASVDSVLTLYDTDGTTVIEDDNDNGSFGTTSSSIAGATLPANGTYYLQVRHNSATNQLRPYRLHLRVQSGAPVAESEPNDTTADADPLPASGWMSGNMATAADIDLFSMALNAGDTVYLSLDLDPTRDATEWNGQLGMGLFAGNQILVVNDAGTTGPDSEAFFMTVKAAGTYYAFVGVPAGGTAIGDYHLSVSVYPAAETCTTYTSTDVPITIPSGGPGVVQSTLTVPGNPRIGDIDVSLQLTHTFMADLDAHLVSPAGNDNGLFTDVGNSTVGGAQITMDTTLDDEAGIPIGPFTVVDGMTYTPELNYRLSWYDYTDAGGVWTLKLYDDATGDGGVLQSWSITICEPPPPPTCPVGFNPVTVYSSDFEAGDDGFTHFGTQDEWERGLPTFAPITTCNSGSNCWKTDLDNTYNASSNQTLQSPAINLAGLTGPVILRWAQKYQIESATFDGAFVQVQEAGGANPTRLWTWLDATMTNTVGNPSTTIQQSAGWGERWADISSYAGQSIEAVFNLSSDTTVQLAGLAIDDVSVTACQQAPSNPAITLAKTVGTDPNVCATTDAITLPYGGDDVTYCYEVENTGDVTFNLHDLNDSELGNLFTGLSYALGPGASVFVTETTTIAATTVNTATWTAYNAADGLTSASATDTATVTVDLPAPAIVLTKTVGTDPNVCATTDDITVAPNTDVTYCYEVENTGNVPFNLHDLTDSELGNILSGFPYALAPGASVFVTQTTPIAVTTVNTATWTAYNDADVQVCSTPNLAIPDNNPTGVSDTLNVPAGGAISDLNVDLGIAHTWVGDLILSLQHVDTGTTATILNRVGAPPGTVGCSGNDIDNIADDEAAQSFESNCTSGNNPTPAYVAGQAYQGGDPASSTLLAAFDGEDLSGNWTLTVSDNAGQDTGTLNEWCLVSEGSGQTVSATDTATVNVEQGDPPNIDVSPLSLSATQGPNMITQQQLDIANTGEADLDWTISEEPDGPAAPQAPNAGPAKLGAPAPVERSDKQLAELLDVTSADVVQDGSFEAGTPNPFWTEASTNFGSPLCTVAACGTGTGTGPLTGLWWAWFGGAANEAGSVAQSVTIPAGGPATLSFWVEQFVCSGSASDYLEVNMDGTQLWVTTAADPACGTLGYRQVTLDVSAYANGAAHTLEFNSETLGGTITNFFVDDVVLDAQGGGVCTNPSDVPWLSVSPTNGTTAGSASTPVQVAFDSTSLAVGTYTANLCIDSNDPDAGPGNGTELVIVPVTLTVSSPTAVTLGNLRAAQAPLPVSGLPLATLPVAGSLALLAAYWLRRKR